MVSFDVFPFLSIHKEKAKNFSISDFSISLGFNRILAALNNKEYPFDPSTEFYSYVASRLLLSYLYNNYLISKMAVFESKRARAFMNQENIHALIKEFNLKIKGDRIDVIDYLKYSPRSPYYKLVNRDLIDGLVLIKEKDLYRILEEAIRKKLLSANKFQEKNEVLQKYSNRLLSILEKSRPKVKITVDKHPPCIEKLLVDLKKHVNLPHMARWVLAVYLIKIGLTEEQILTIFSDAPDYNRKKTLYYLNHIKKMNYSMPSCNKIRSYGLCVSNCNVKNPLDLLRGRKHGKQRT